MLLLIASRSVGFDLFNFWTQLVSARKLSVDPDLRTTCHKKDSPERQIAMNFAWITFHRICAHGVSLRMTTNTCGHAKQMIFCSAI